MPRTVGFDATSAARQSAGIGRYTRELLMALDRRFDETRYRCFYCGAGELMGSIPRLSDRFQIRRLPVSDRVTNAMWHRMHVPLPVELLIGGFDLFHSPDFTLPPVWGKPSILTVHDLAFLTAPECAYPTLREYLRVVVPRSIARATRVIAVSESTRDDLERLLGVDRSRIEVIYEGVSPRFRPPESAGALGARLERAGIVAPYILSVGTLEPRKNYVRLLEAYHALRRRGVDHELVIAGGKGWLYDAIFRTVDELRLRPHVRFVQPDDAMLVDLYGGASVFVFPSVYEGFGIPPLEALACGAPVVCSNSSSLPEIVGDAAVLFDPLDVEGMTEAIDLVLRDEGVRLRLRGTGPSRAAQFTWDAAAERTHALYQRVVAGG
jgi:glycosyltransferase involved in cell wall biosynthesis